MISDVESPFTSTGLLNSGFAATLQDSSHSFQSFQARIDRKKKSNTSFVHQTTFHSLNLMED